jgi:hypothetical protein
MRIATIRAYLGTGLPNREANARGQGRSDGGAASRAVRNLLREKQLRRQSNITLYLELVITNAPRLPRPKADGDER